MHNLGKTSRVDLWRRIAPLALMAALLLPAVFHRGIHVHDEAHFLLVANTVAQGAAGILTGKPISEIRDRIHESGGALYFAAKPGYIYLLALWGLVLGGLTATKALFLNFLLALGTLALLQDSAQRLFGARAAFFAAALLALSPLFLDFSATALGPVPATFFCILAFWLAIRDKPALWRVLLAGLAAAAAFLCHYNIVVLLLTFGIGTWPGGSWLKRIGLPAAFVLFLAIFHLGTVAVDRALAEAYPEFRSYGSELVRNFSFAQLQDGGDEAARDAIPEDMTDGQRGYDARAWLHLAYILFNRLHLLLPVAVIGLAWLGRSKKLEGRHLWLLAWWAFLPTLFWALYPWKVERSFVHCVPGLVLAAAVVIQRIAPLDEDPEAPRNRRDIALGLLISLVLLSLLTISPGNLFGKSPFERMVRQNESLISRAPEGTFTGRSFHWRTAPLWKWYLGPERLNRGKLSPGVDFASSRQPLLVGADAQSILPDPNYAAYMHAHEWIIVVGESVEAGDDYGTLLFMTNSNRKYDLLTELASGAGSP